MQEEKYEENQKVLLGFLKEEDNTICADCGAKQPRWASCNLGVFICMRCAGLHRNMGVQISRVKSVNLDRWKVDETRRMLFMGNRKAKRIYEFDLPDNFQRPKTDTGMEIFIRAKYEHKRYADKNLILRDLPLTNQKVNGESELKEVQLIAPAGLEHVKSDRLRRWYLPTSSARYMKVDGDSNAVETKKDCVAQAIESRPVTTATANKNEQINDDDEFGPMVSARSNGQKSQKSENSARTFSINADLASLDPKAFQSSNHNSCNNNYYSCGPKRSISEILSLYNTSQPPQQIPVNNQQFTNLQFYQQQFVPSLLPQRQQSCQSYYNLVANSRDTFL